MSVNTDAMTDEEFEAYMNQEMANEASGGSDEIEVDVPEEEPIEEEETTTEEEVEDLEQPEADPAQGTEEDSNEETETEEADEDDTEEEDSETPGEDEEQTEDEVEDEEVESEEDSEKDSDEPEESQDEQEVAEQVHKLRANGMDIEVTTDEALVLASKGMDYTKKMQEIAPWRKTISALKDQNLSHTDVNTMIDVMKGDKNAIAALLKKADIDPLDLDLEAKHNAKRVRKI